MKAQLRNFQVQVQVSGAEFSTAEEAFEITAPR